VSAPREVLPGRFYKISRRCVMRMFLIRPDEETNNAFIYCLIEAAQRFGIEVILPVAMSNHHHVTIYDRYGRYPEFMHRFHELFARSQNALRGRWDKFWSADAPSVVRLVDREDVMRSLTYVATNPVNDHLVERVHHWPGVNGYVSLLANRRLVARRPRHFFREDGPMPEEVTMYLTIPPELGPRDEIVRDLEERVTAVERQLADERNRTGRRVIGRRNVKLQDWRDSPETFEKRRGLKPTVKAKNKWARIEALQRNKAFVVAYRVARRLWLAGFETCFPPGTYWLRRFAGVRVGDVPFALLPAHTPPPAHSLMN
jgi:REP element-mobilizing transposase RayT